MGLIRGDTRSMEYGVYVCCPSESPSCRVMSCEHACLSMCPVDAAKSGSGFRV